MWLGLYLIYCLYIRILEHFVCYLCYYDEFEELLGQTSFTIEKFFIDCGNYHTVVTK